MGAVAKVCVGNFISTDLLIVLAKFYFI